jgi:opacity protein-like surface antigen
MRSLLLCLFGSVAAFAQPISVGVKGGVPLTDFLDTVSSGNVLVRSKTQRYIVGPTVELRLPAGFGVEFDALYRHFNYSATTSLANAVTSIDTTANAWEFPLLLKKRFASGPVRPFVSAGVTWNKISGVSQSIRSSVGLTTAPELSNDVATGFVAGAGLDMRLLILRITPEIRYTRWGSNSFRSIFPPGGSLNSNQNQAEFLVGFSF